MRACYLSCATTSVDIASPWTTAPMALSIAERLAGWGAAVEVLEPDSVKAELARLGAELVQRYAPR